MILNDTKPTMQELFAIFHEWQKDYHFEKDVITFQNKEQLANIRFNNNSFHEIAKHPKGAENLPETLMNPTEIWSRWNDPKDQMVVLRNYILIGQNISYICSTKDGIVIDAFACTASQVSRYRKGLILLR
jgi:hypothetical protein